MRVEPETVHNRVSRILAAIEPADCALAEVLIETLQLVEVLANRLGDLERRMEDEIG